jgi:ribose transport system substrate-binding protein
MKRSINFAFVCTIIFLFALSAACGGAPPTTEKAEKTVVFITNTASDFWKIARKGTEKADAELADVKVVFKLTSSGEAKEQEKFLNEAFNRDNADAVAISPADPVSQKEMINKAAKRFLVITQDSDAPDTDRTLYLGADNRAAGRQAGDLMKKALPQGGKIMVFVGNRETLNAQQRFEGLKEALQGSKVEVIDLIEDNNDYMKAEDNVTQAMQKHPDLAGMVGLWGYNGPIILRAVQNAKKEGKIKIVCFDDAREVLDGIKSGAIFGTVAQQPFEYGYQAVHLASKILKGDKSVIPANKIVPVPTVVVQRNNVDDYRSKHEQLLAAR